MHRIAFAFMAMLVLSAPAVAEGVVACGDFRTGWSAALRKLALVLSSPEFGAPDQEEREPVLGIVGVEGRLVCREGIVGQLGLKAAEEEKLEQAVASVLMALDRGMSAENAAATAAALKTESRNARKEAMSAWGPYELTWSVPEAGARFLLNLPEN